MTEPSALGERGCPYATVTSAQMSPLLAWVTRRTLEPIEMPKKLRCYFGFHRWHTWATQRATGRVAIALVGA